MFPPVFMLPRRWFCLIPAVILLLLLTGCPPKFPCDEKIKDPEPYRQMVLQHPLIQTLSETLTIEEVRIGACFVKGKANAAVMFRTPSDFSALGLLYRGSFDFIFTKDGTLSIPEDGFWEIRGWEISSWDGESIDLIVGVIRKKIEELESNLRVREVLTRTQADPSNAAHYLNTGQVFRKNARLTYSFWAHQVREYLLPSDMEWENFPEIRQAHEIIQTRLLIGELSNCAIGTGELHNYTQAQMDEWGGWYMTVALQCNEKWKDAFLHLLSDGSFERLGIQTEY